MHCVAVGNKKDALLFLTNSFFILSVNKTNADTERPINMFK